MTHNEWIIIIATVGISTPLGLYILIRKVQRYVNAGDPSNVLRRQQDIELGDYIEPVRPEQVHYYPDLLGSTHQTISNHASYYDRVSSYWSKVPSYISNRPSYYSGTQPSYHTVDNGYINSCLENENILYSYFIFLIFIIIILAIIFWKINSLYSMTLLIPFSTFDIDFRDSFEWKFNSYKFKDMILYLKLQDLTKDIKSLLLSLPDDVNYSMSLYFISNYKKWKNKEKNHPLIIDDPIIINKESDPILITQFIMKNLDKKCYFISDWLFKDDSLNSMDPVILTVTVGIKVKI